MSPIEHYFENLLTMDSDMKGEPNKNALSREVQEAIEICADYIKHNQLYSNAISDDNNAEMIDMLTELKSETKNNLAQERYQDLIEYFGGEDTVLKDRKEFKAWLERVKWHVKRADELGRKFGQLRPTTKDCLLVEQIVDAVIDELKRYFHDEYYQRTSIQDCRDCFIEDVLNHLPSVTPRKPRCKDCKWWKDSDGKYRRGCGAESQCPINTHAVYCGEGYCYMFSPKADMRGEEV